MLQLYFSYTSSQSSRYWVLFTWLSENWLSCFPYKYMLMVSHGTIEVRVGRDARIFSSNDTKHGISHWVPPLGEVMHELLAILHISGQWRPSEAQLYLWSLEPSWHCSLKWWKALTRTHLSLLFCWLTYPTLLPKIHFAWFSVPSQIFTSDSFPVYQHPLAVLLFSYIPK